MMSPRSKMVRTQVQFTEDQLSDLRSRASHEGVSVSELVRRAVDGYAADPSGPSPEDKRQRALAVAGRFSSGCADVASDHDRHLTDTFGTDALRTDAPGTDVSGPHASGPDSFRPDASGE